jgi:phage tail sheath protein FI
VISISLAGGSNGSVASISAADFIGKDNGPGRRTGIQAFVDNDSVSLMAVPGVTDPNVQLMLVAHCENLASRFAVLDLPQDSKKVADVIAHRDIFDSHYAALYHPWLEVFDPLDKKNLMIPPSGSILGIYARSDNTRGVHKAPANEGVRACGGLDCQYNKGEQDILNPKGVNLIRAFAGQGIRVWGARTATSNPSWKYVNVRRLFIFIEESIKANTSWVVFEPNDELLWVRVKRTIDVFLTGLWRLGSLAGGSTAEAFFVDVGRSTMSQDDIDNGRLVCVIGVAPVKPAEFVIFRITQKTNESGE